MIFRGIASRQFACRLEAVAAGVLAGASALPDLASGLGLAVTAALPDGSALAPGTVIWRGRGTPLQLAQAEEALPGAVGKASGVATAAARFVAAAGGSGRVVCGAWKKVPVAVRADLRQAIAVGGAGIRLVDAPFVYLDKNYVRLLGGVAAAVIAGGRLPGRVVAVQIRGETAAIAAEAQAAYQAGAGILMVDTGREEDLAAVARAAAAGGWRGRVQLAFAGGVDLNQVPRLFSLGADILDVGRAVIDAPLLDFRFEVEPLREAYC